MGGKDRVCGNGRKSGRGALSDAFSDPFLASVAPDQARKAGDFYSSTSTGTVAEYLYQSEM